MHVNSYRLKEYAKILLEYKLTNEPEYIWYVCFSPSNNYELLIIYIAACHVLLFY